MKIAVDEGHNRGQDIGAVAIGNENTMNIQTGEKVITKLQALGHEILRVIDKVPQGVSVSTSLADRVNAANSWGADLYVSIHANAGGGYGTEVWIGSESGRDVATKIVNQITALGFTNRGVKVQGVDGSHLYVLRYTNMKAILVEQCFVDSQDDMNNWNPESMANAIVAGITGQAITAPAPKPVEILKYDESIPTGPNIFQIPNTTFYIEKRADGDMGIHLDRGNYLTIRKGGSPVVAWNNNKGQGGSKILF
ncbi:N-acetylmuramoyl-L-alanine amidase [Clostridium sp. Mt-5]|uniref:N-acetylmuramoyl-L-alanine amidase n=1 Tax=Clostridium moutaii TaxID=3240932 RepID=A0ABV4BRT1_9CLOT